jgi:hypothetical protein
LKKICLQFLFKWLAWELEWIPSKKNISNFCIGAVTKKCQKKISKKNFKKKINLIEIFETNMPTI